MKSFVYRIINSLTEDVYVGSTVQTLHNRFKAHKSNARLGKPGKLYDHMRLHGIDHFSIELIEECDIEHVEELGLKERHYHSSMRPSLNMKSPNVVVIRNTGRVYQILYSIDNSQSYVGSTIKNIESRLSDHKSASLQGTTRLYQFMRENGRDNFQIHLIEDNIPVEQLIERENHWIAQLKPTLNKNTNLCITDKERDRLKYLKNRQKRLQQVKERRLIKRDEINAQKREHYSLNRDRLAEKDKLRRQELRETVIEPFTSYPELTRGALEKETKFELKIIAKRLGLKVSPKLKDSLIDKILLQQFRLFGK